MLNIFTACFLSAFMVSALAEARPRYYVKLNAIAQSKSAQCGLKPVAARIVPSLLDKEPTITTKKVTKSATEGAKGRRRRLISYGIVFRITRCKYEVGPPKPGRPFPLLRAVVETAIDAEKIPSGQLALAGTGKAEMAAEVSKASKREIASILHDTLAEATKRSIKQFVSKLGSRKKTRKRKRRQRRRRSR